MRELEPRLFPYIWRYSKAEQLKICAVVLASLPFYFASLDLPKRIVNDAITGKAFAHGEATAPFLEMTVQWPDVLGGGTTRLFEGFQLDRFELLLGLSTLFLGLVLINGAFKFWINLQKGVLGERMLRRLRFQLFSLMLRFTPEAQREVKSSETATIIRDEVEPIGSFIGDAIVVPVFLGTQAATALAFIMMQNVWLGLAAGGMVAVQITVIPRLRREIIRLSRQRQIASRNLAGRVAEVLDGLPAVTLNDTGRWERAEVGGRLYSLYDLRLRIYRRKFAVKYLNNLLAQVTPFLFYAIGGVFALKGELDIGQLVAVLAAYRDLPPPLKELIDWDQQRLDVEVKYETVAAHFGPQRLRPAERETRKSPPLLGSPLRIEGLALRDPQGGVPIEVGDVEAGLPGHLALVPPGPLAQEFVQVLGGLRSAPSGTIRVGEHDLSILPRSTHAHRIAFAGLEPVLFPGTLRDNVLYGLRTRPLRKNGIDLSKARINEAVKTGNPFDSIDDPWIDYAQLGVRDPVELDLRILDLLGRLDLGDDLYRFGLGALSSVVHDTPAGQRMIAAREHLREHFAQNGLADLVIPFARGRYNEQATVAENLMFGVPRDPSLTDPRRLAGVQLFRQALEKVKLLDELDRMGVAIARTLKDIFSDVPPGHPLFRRFSLITADALPDYLSRLARLPAEGRLDQDDSVAFLALALAYVEPRMRFGLLDHPLKRRIVGARGVVQDFMHDHDGCDIESYDPNRINPRSTVLDNLLFGRIDTARMHGEAIIQREARAVFRAFDLERGIQRRGLEKEVGNRGQLLTERVRIRIGLARALLRDPEILVVDRVSEHLDRGVETLLEVTSAVLPRGSVVASVSAEADAAQFPARLALRPAEARLRTAAE
ncbi:ABC transporter transmembrane domain-containing protein [Methylobacterium sp. NEAU K]|uniref:ABC transporter transmembrane domain-containing protein n=1 Tax=Methylobacterium sp. NEAU K TaxID=3064946 RepID=UPI00273704B4|nr:ABC transporter transmembrane domain-containing protein [Methylobacterium sp. NEAU K]MDP4004977.1 ABC transporter transmembrane domain-containing protein [Methylobacterium sp. NEAU K]